MIIIIFFFSLIFTKIGPSIFVDAKGKVGVRDEGYAWALKS